MVFRTEPFSHSDCVFHKDSERQRGGFSTRQHSAVLGKSKS